MLADNHFTTLPAERGRLFHSHYLSLNDNQLTSLPSEIEHSHKWLYLGY
ncbi:MULTISPECIES: hypothetical protein [unclassified Neochlamydia]|nr:MULTISPECIES: hypothetical protein [unclassified Neochlamydia]